MASAVTVTFGANSTQFQAELARMQTMTRNAATRMSASAASAGHIGGLSTMVREAVTIPREILEGRGIGRIVASLSIFIQGMSMVSRGAMQAATAERILADAYAEQSIKANLAAVAAMNKAEATALEAEAEGFEIDTTLLAADADAAEAVAARGAAAAMAQKAAAAETAAVAQAALASSTAGAGIGMLLLTGIFVGAAVAIGAVYEKFWGLKAVLDSLSFKGADLKDDYIPLLKRHINDARNAQKEVTDEVKKTVSEYNSAATAAQRQSKATKEHYDHLKKMLEIQKQTELAGAKTPAQKEAIEARYSDKELKLEKQQQGAELADKQMEKTNLELQAHTKLRQAGDIKVATKEEDQKTLGQLNQNATAAEKLLEGGGIWDEFKKNAAVRLGGDPKATQELIDRTEAGGRDAAQKAIAARNSFADKVEGNDELRKNKETLVKDAAKDSAAAVKIGLEVPQITKENAQKNSDSAEEKAAKLAEEKAKDATRGSDAKGYSLNSQQRLGAYAATAPILLQQLNELRGIRSNTSHHSTPSNHPPGERKPQLGTRPPGWVAPHIV